jgi:hypothetical protein
MFPKQEPMQSIKYGVTDRDYQNDYGDHMVHIIGHKMPGNYWSEVPYVPPPPPPPPPPPTELYNFTTFTFTNAGVTGSTGPDLTQLRTNAGYSAQSWTQDTTNNYLNMTTNGIQLWTVPKTGTYQIIAAGARGGGTGLQALLGKGIIVFNTYSLTMNTVIKILVGQQGVFNNTQRSGGGGGTYVVTSENSPILIAGGGGGKGGLDTGINGQNITDGASAAVGGAGGTNGSGGSVSFVDDGGGGGGGLIGNGVQSASPNPAFGGLSFINNGVGGSGLGGGGFGGGGGGSVLNRGSGGGGGYSGGGAGRTSGTTTGYSGGGGGSYDSVNVIGNYQATQYLESITANGGTYTDGFCSGHGFVRITAL